MRTEKEKQIERETLDTIYSAAESAAPVTVQIGRFINNVCHAGIVLKEAPPSVLTVLVHAGYLCDVTKEGVVVWKL